MSFIAIKIRICQIFVVKHYSKSKQYNGKYILAFKKEILYSDDKDFRGCVSFGLRKVIEE